VIAPQAVIARRSPALEFTIPSISEESDEVGNPAVNNPGSWTDGMNGPQGTPLVKAETSAS
jgi:hypothetical protein